MAIQNVNLQPFEKLLNDEDPLEIVWYLDEVMLTLVQHSGNEGYLPELGHWYYILRLLRDAFYACTPPHCNGNH